MAFEENLPLVLNDYELDAVFDNGAFSLALFSWLCNEFDEDCPDFKNQIRTFYLENHTKVTILSANSAQTSFDLQSHQLPIIGTLMKDRRFASGLARQMNNNSYVRGRLSSEFQPYVSERPRSIFIYLLKDSQGQEVTIILEGLVINGKGKLHDHLRSLSFAQNLQAQIKIPNAMRSGHIWGPVIMADSLVNNIDSVLDSNVAKRIDQKIALVLIRAGYILIDPEGNIVEQEVIVNLLNR